MAGVNLSTAIATGLAVLASCANIGNPDLVPEPEPDAGVIPAPSPVPPALCESPDLMVVLDRSGSMAQRADGTMPENTPDGALETKWYAAVTAIESLTARYEPAIQFGISLFPRDPEGAGGFDCSNLDTWLTQYLPPETNDPSCSPAELLVSPGPTTASAIAESIDVFGTGLCQTTPIGAGLASAAGALMQSRDPDRDQYVVLITDGADNCDENEGYTTISTAEADALRAAGIKTYVVGFDGSGEGIDPEQLNDLACAGGTALDFAASCADGGTGGFRAVVPPDVELFLRADDQATLEAVLDDVSNEITCVK